MRVQLIAARYLGFGDLRLGNGCVPGLAAASQAVY
jgi:hypothetical protein